MPPSSLRAMPTHTCCRCPYSRAYPSISSMTACSSAGLSRHSRVDHRPPEEDPGGRVSQPVYYIAVVQLQKRFVVLVSPDVQGAVHLLGQTAHVVPERGWLPRRCAVERLDLQRLRLGWARRQRGRHDVRPRGIWLVDRLLAVGCRFRAFAFRMRVGDDLRGAPMTTPSLRSLACDDSGGDVGASGRSGSGCPSNDLRVHLIDTFIL